MKDRNNFGRLLGLLLITLTICFGLYGLPDTIFSQPIKKVDILADIREGADSVSAPLDSLRMQLESALPAEGDAADSTAMAATDSIALAMALRDSIYQVMSREKGNSDSKGVRIEDFSAGHTGLRRFFAALNQSRNRPVRIAFMGDSFIEGDIMVADFRSAMQQRFGGHGVGFVPITSVASQYRPTINQQSEGWKMYSIINTKKPGYTLSGMVFEAKSDRAKLSFRTTTQYAALKKVNSLKFLYDRNEGAIMQFVYHDIMDTVVQALPPSSSVTQYELNDTITEGSFTFSNAQGFRALGIALEDRTGVVVDNYSLRGNSGLIFERLDPQVCESFRTVRPYDLIILQYGLNAIDESMLDYGWYGARMTKVVRHIQHCFPDTDVLLLSTPDRANQYNGAFATMPAVLALLHTQRQTARSAQIPFWNMFGAMGGENSMTKFVSKGWASKDYTHMSFKGGREIAGSFMNALMLEKEFYDELENAR
jgi:hypothetical protein